MKVNSLVEFLRTKELAMQTDRIETKEALGSLELDDLRRERLTELCQDHGIQELSLFGSALSGQLGAESDVDILVTFEPQARPGFLTPRRRRQPQ